MHPSPAAGAEDTTSLEDERSRFKRLGLQMKDDKAYNLLHGGVPCKTAECSWITAPGVDFCTKPECKVPWHHVVVTGKWFNYGIIFMVMIFDSIMTKNQIVYRPQDNGQYVDPGPIGVEWEGKDTGLLVREIPWTKYVKVVDTSGGSSGLWLEMQHPHHTNGTTPAFEAAWKSRVSASTLTTNFVVEEFYYNTSDTFYEHSGDLKGQIWTIFDPTTIATMRWQLQQGLGMTDVWGITRNQELDIDQRSDNPSWSAKFCPKGARSECSNCCTYQQSLWYARTPYRNVALWKQLVEAGIFPSPPNNVYLVDQPMASRYYGAAISTRMLACLPLVFGLSMLFFLFHQHARKKKAMHMVNHIVEAKHVGDKITRKFKRRHTVKPVESSSSSSPSSSSPSSKSPSSSADDTTGTFSTTTSADQKVDQKVGENGGEKEQQDSRRDMGSFGNMLVRHGTVATSYEPGGGGVKADGSASPVNIGRTYSENMMVDKMVDQHSTTSKNKILSRESWKRECWKLCDEPQSSKLASFWGYTVTVTIVASIVALIFETLDPKLPRYSWNMQPSSYDNFEKVITVVFSLELICRFVVTGSKSQFMKDPLNWFDIVSILPLFITLAISSSNQSRSYDDTVVTYVGGLRILRVTRIFKVLRRFQSTQILGLAAARSLKPLIVPLFFLMVAALGMGVLMALAEPCFRQSCQFEDVFNSVYFVLVTVSTVGYGDQVPVTW